MTLKINNRNARHLWLQSHGLSANPTGQLDILGCIKSLGFVQLDTIRNVTRAHHHILWSRNQNYREPMLNKLLAEDRAIFEHFTHDASLLPMEFYPVWRRQFRRMGEKIARSNYYQAGLSPSDCADIKARIEAEGPLSTHAFNTKITGKKAMWARPPHKKALDKMWYSGELATSHRINFKKFYDLSERVIPEAILAVKHEDAHQLDQLCHGALNRLGFGTAGDIQRFWAAADAIEVKDWIAANRHNLVDVEIEARNGSWMPALANCDIKERLAQTSPPTTRLRILNPFDPAIRDRDRLYRLFGFEYRNEIFVPAAKRKWGYYVYPLLEGDRFVGRIELKADRKAGTLSVTQFWPEPGIKWSAARQDKLEAELRRFARAIAVRVIHF